MNIKALYRMLIPLLVGIIFIAFFLPWISAESEAIGGVSKLLTGKRQATIDSISGFDVPVLANSEESRFMISIIKIFQPGITDADKKSYLIWGVPLLAIGLLVGSWKWGNNKWFNLGVAVLGCLIFVFSTYKIMTTDLDKLILKVNIGYGLWLVLLGYLGIGLLALGRFFSSK